MPRQLVCGNCSNFNWLPKSSFLMGFDSLCLFIVNLMQALEIDCCDATLYSNRSFCYLQMGKAQKALLDADACVEKRPDWVKGYYWKGAAQMSLQVGNIMCLLVICCLVYITGCRGSSVQFLFPRSTRKQLAHSWMDWNWILQMPRSRKYFGNYSFVATPTQSLHMHTLIGLTEFVQQTCLA